MALIKITDDLVLSNKGIKSIKVVQDYDMSGEGYYIEVRYLLDTTEMIPLSEVSMEELLSKLGRNPRSRGSADSA